MLQAGLDARVAAVVMRTARNTANTRRTVVCTSHQPSIDIFEPFDELLLLKRDGQTVYSGNPSDLVFWGLNAACDVNKIINHKQ